MSMDTSIIGQLSRAASGHRDLRLERAYDTDPDDLFAALSDPDRLARWFATVDGDLRVGGRYRVRFDEQDVSQHVTGTINTCEPPRLLEVSWEMRGEPTSTVSARITATASGASMLVLEHRGLSDASAAGHGAGWQAYAEALGAVLSGGAGLGAQWDARWSDLLPHYKQQLEAS